MKKFKISLLGTTYSSDSRSALGVQMDAQQRLEEKYGLGKFIVHVEDFTDTHFMVDIERHLADPEMVDSLQAPDEFLEVDKSFLWPELYRIPWGWLYTTIMHSDDAKYELNQYRKELNCSKLCNLSITTTPTHVVVEMWKEQKSNKTTKP